MGGVEIVVAQLILLNKIDIPKNLTEGNCNLQMFTFVAQGVTLILCRGT